MRMILTMALLFTVSTPALAEEASAPPNPLSPLIGVWEGDAGIDVAPAQKKTGLPPGSAATSPYFERITITDGPSATNASEQDLVSVAYHQQVFRKSDQKQFHDQIGYWIWDKKNQKLIDSFCIPRGVCITAEGPLKHPGEFAVNMLRAAEASFAAKNAQTRAFEISMKLNGDGSLSYTQKTDLFIYGRPFTHIDASTLKKKG
ncbi:hypothetical protein DFP86_10689 [Paludibacterium purpuratum]|uniref:THAP4-like heme-binding domain-containing protein n=2 Tax=Paludibacterium purpuratum TaxID=1144873 RepID=A0A4R7B5K0_9NEIS|nr:hypothetical protein DFP86_10689 [Paludibacterium purpuratum]